MNFPSVQRHTGIGVGFLPGSYCAIHCGGIHEEDRKNAWGAIEGIVRAGIDGNHHPALSCLIGIHHSRGEKSSDKEIALLVEQKKLLVSSFFLKSAVSGKTISRFLYGIATFAPIINHLAIVFAY